MPFREAIRLALRVIWSQKMKSSFSVIGVFIGVTFLIAVVSILQGMNAYSADPELLESNDAAAIQRETRLEKGSAYGQIDAGAAAGADDWTTYRGNAFRVTK